MDGGQVEDVGDSAEHHAKVSNNVVPSLQQWARGCGRGLRIAACAALRSQVSVCGLGERAVPVPASELPERRDQALPYQAVDSVDGQHKGFESAAAHSGGTCSRPTDGPACCRMPGQISYKMQLPIV